MDLLFYHQQSKLTRNKPLNNVCKLKLASDADFLLFTSEFYIEYMRMGRTNYLNYEHGFTINKKTGDISVIYRLINKKENNHILERNTMKARKNDFDMLVDLSNRGFYNGEKRYNFWGVKYARACKEIFALIVKDLAIDTHLHDKDYKINPLYDTLLEYHLNKKGIKGHDCVYWDICEVYPKKKYLKANDYKFLPALLDEYGIKSKYLVGALSSREPSLPKMNIRSVKFLCTLFGENYVDYIRDFDWQTICSEMIYKNKFFVCEDESEKRAIAKSLKNYSEVDAYIGDGILSTVQELFILKKYLGENNMFVKIKGSSCQHLNSLRDSWELHRKHFKLGYKLKYTLPEDMVNHLERPIEVGDKIFKPSLILSEDQFKIEGMIMKNCMANQFNVGNLYVHASISCGKKRINVQYRKGNLNQNRGKANSAPPAEFEKAVEIFTERMSNYPHIFPVKEKYDIIKRS